MLYYSLAFVYIIFSPPRLSRGIQEHATGSTQNQAPAEEFTVSDEIIQGLITLVNANSQRISKIEPPKACEVLIEHAELSRNYYAGSLTRQGLSPNYPEINTSDPLTYLYTLFNTRHRPKNEPVIPSPIQYTDDINTNFLSTESDDASIYYICNCLFACATIAQNVARNAAIHAAIKQDNASEFKNRAENLVDWLLFVFQSGDIAQIKKIVNRICLPTYCSVAGEIGRTVMLYCGDIRLINIFVRCYGDWYYNFFVPPDSSYKRYLLAKKAGTDLIPYVAVCKATKATITPDFNPALALAELLRISIDAKKKRPDFA